MEAGKVVEAVLAAGKKSGFPADDREEEEDAMAMASSSPASTAAIFAFLAPPLSLLRHVASLCAGYLGLVGGGGGLKPSVPAPASSSSSTAAASEDCTEVEVVLEVRSRGFPPPKPRSTPVESRKAARGGDHH